jgi:hypothetical protein
MLFIALASAVLMADTDILTERNGCEHCRNRKNRGKHVNKNDILAVILDFLPQSYTEFYNIFLRETMRLNSSLVNVHDDYTVALPLTRALIDDINTMSVYL